MKQLVIVESPAKGKTIARYLGADYQVEASFGHIRDLPQKNMGVDISAGFVPEYEISPDKKKRVTELKRFAKNAEQVWIATDEDREGEAIGWHLCQALDLDVAKTNRIVFHEITKTAIEHAITHPRHIDMNLVDAQQARRILDRIVGYEVSPVLWRRVKPGLSAGRVQSVAVKLIVEREREIRAFIPEESWRILANVHGGDMNFPIEFTPPKGKKLRTESDATAFFSGFGIMPDSMKKSLDKKGNILFSSSFSQSFSLGEIEKKESNRFPGAPFTTSTLQQEASRKLGFGVKMTMDIAQQLYQEGYITYMRTDSVNLSEFAIRSTHDYIEKTFGSEYALPNGRHYKTKQANAQEAHEAIRPTEIQKSPDAIRLDGPKKKLYTLIWERTVASQMKEARIETTTYHFSPISDDTALASQQWIAKGEVILFPGFMKLYIEGTDDEDDEKKDAPRLPRLLEGDIVGARSLDASQKFSLPPPRYTEASLVKKLESEGIGRPSTYAPTIQTIIDRGYVEKEEKKLKPTDIAFVVTDYLDMNLETFMQYDFTASVETEFDEIATGNMKWQSMLGSFYTPFHEKITALLDSNERFSGERILGKDPKTGNSILVRMSRFGPVVQIGTPDELGEGVKPQYANLPAGESLETITFENAIGQFSLPRALGTHEGDEIIIGAGRFGPYVKYGSSYVSIPKGEDPLTISLARSIELIDMKKKEDAPICIYEGHPVTKGKGRFGPFIKWQSFYVSVGKGYDWDALTESDCATLIEAKKKRESERVLLAFPEENIAVEKGRWGPFIRHGKENYKLIFQKKKIDTETIPGLTLADLRGIILEQNPKAFGPKKETSTSTKKSPAKKSTTTKKKKTVSKKK